ncbi:3-ketodihydrosphingosine reductase-like isoform X2 [Hylaeus volcanicus]|uniref:3-ketodihydrosphingosine reductase-like isoform X2 n=1 Tax=Hylaeus volcanicus TaxID=313075 RepID=UPI0023B7E9AC|nr:3-ketodihydrosphingosine reductase-like isoform X2 [Hylaeus volcanicus]XP_053991737.1 3-ketodihydrosphingosine reductase-like isoform X2 [Hylaeus volcanicus]
MRMLFFRRYHINPEHKMYFFGLLLILFLIYVIFNIYVWWVIMEGKICRGEFVVKGKHICITGGSEGIGLNVALCFLQRHVKVITIISRSYSKIEHALQTIVAEAQKSRKENLVVQGFHGNVTDYKFIQSLFTYIESPENNVFSLQDSFVKGYYIKETSVITTSPTQARIDVLVNSAGICISDLFHKMTPGELHYQMNVNVLGTLYPSQQIMKSAYADSCLNSNSVQLRKKPSRVIVILSSQAGQTNMYGFVAYGASKFALRGAWEALSMEGYPVGVRTICVFPPSTDTPGFVEENLRKPHITKELEGMSSLMPARTVAQSIVDGICKQGCYQINYNVIGRYIEANSHGFSPYSSYFEYMRKKFDYATSLFLTVYWNYRWKKEIQRHALYTQSLQNSDESLQSKQKKEN